MGPGACAFLLQVLALAEFQSQGYWAQDIYSVNSAFGSASDLTSLSTALHNRGMYLMLDVVTNHFAYLGAGNSVDYSTFYPFNSQSYFHDFCLIDYSNINSIQNCWEGDNIVSLPDLRTENENVYSVWYSWIADMVSTYGIDGIRLDSAQQVNYNFTPGFEDAAGVYVVGEVFNGDPAFVTPYQEYMSGLLKSVLPPLHYISTMSNLCIYHIGMPSLYYVLSEGTVNVER